MKKSALQSSYGEDVDLPDYSADWQPPKAGASSAEIEARFYYEFARESQVILSLTEKLCQFSPREILAAAVRGASYPGEPLLYLHARCASIAYARRLGINLREVSWNQLQPNQRQSLINAFSHISAFRLLPNHMLLDFARELIDPTTPKTPKTPQSDLSPRWYRSSRLFWRGTEAAAILIDWSQGPQAVKRSIDKWFVGHKRELGRLKSEGKLPNGGFFFRLTEETGQKNPKRKYQIALRGLGAMRLLSTHSLTEAIRISEGSGRKEGSLFYGKFDAKRPAGHGAWKKGIHNAREIFQQLFYPQDDYSLHLRGSHGLPDLEEPISYQRYCKKKGNR